MFVFGYHIVSLHLGNFKAYYEPVFLKIFSL